MKIQEYFIKLEITRRCIPFLRFLYISPRYWIRKRLIAIESQFIIIPLPACIIFIVDGTTSGFRKRYIRLFKYAGILNIFLNLYMCFMIKYWIQSQDIRQNSYSSLRQLLHLLNRYHCYVNHICYNLYYLIHFII